MGTDVYSVIPYVLSQKYKLNQNGERKYKRYFKDVNTILPCECRHSQSRKNTNMKNLSTD